jgi:hypothetical protein
VTVSEELREAARPYRPKRRWNCFDAMVDARRDVGFLEYLYTEVGLTEITVVLSEIDADMERFLASPIPASYQDYEARREIDLAARGLVRALERMVATARASARCTGRNIYCDPCWSQHLAVSGVPPYLTVTKQRADRFGVTVQHLQRVVNAAKGRCEICDRNLDDRWCVDHNHDNGEIRGVLCSPCNTALGMFQDSPDVLDAALAYLEERGHYGTDSAEDTK